MQALEGLRVIDLTQHLSGPYCTMILGDLGAEIIKVEKRGEGDDQRKLGPFVNGEGAPFMTINRNKKSLTLNLKAPEGKALLLELVKDADVLIENFRPGVTKSLGIDYDALKAINGALIYCSISGYGQTGPASHKGGYDLLAQGMSGLMDLNTQVGARPTKMPISLFDIGAGITAAYSIMSAYIYRLKHGAGQYIDVSLVESGMALTMIESTAFFVNGVVPKVAGTRNHLSAPYQAYRALDGYVIVGAGNQRLWEKFCQQVIDQPELIDDPRFSSVSERHRHADALEEILEAILLNETISHWSDRMDAAGVPGGPINTFDQALDDPHIKARGMVLDVQHPVAGTVRTLGIPAKMSETPGSVRSPAPTLGQHTDEILHTILGKTSEDVAALRANGIV